MDIYSYLLERNGYSTSGKGYFAFYVVNKEDGFGDRLPFKKEVKEVKTNLSYVPELFRKAVTLLRSKTPSSHTDKCEFGKWLKESANF